MNLFVLTQNSTQIPAKKEYKRAFFIFYLSASSGFVGSGATVSNMTTSNIDGASWNLDIADDIVRLAMVSNVLTQ